MFVSPNQTQIKYKKTRKGKLKKLSYKPNYLNFGTFGLKALEPGILNGKQIEAARRAITRKIKRKGKVWIRVFPNIPVTKKPTGSRMGKGKGSVSHWITKIKGGSILFEICGGINFYSNLEALKAASHKLPIKTEILR